MAQRRRKARMQRRKQHIITALCIAGGLGAAALSILVCLLVFGIGSGASTPVSAPVATSLPYEASSPFSAGDLTSAQMAQIREQGRMSVSDGPRGVSVGDSLDDLLIRFPASYTGAQPDDMQILYCADYFENRNGLMTVLPPRGLLTADSSAIFVTFLAPTSAYPAGTQDNYGEFEHVYCQFTVEPDTMTVSSIVLGLEQ